MSSSFAAPGQSALLFPNLALDAGLVITASNEANGDADNLAIERVDSYWSPVDFSVARTVLFTWPSNRTFNCVYIPHAYVADVVTGTTSWQIDAPWPTPTQTKTSVYQIQSSEIAIPRNELTKPNVGLTSDERASYIAANRFSSFLVFDEPVTASTLQVTFTPSSPGGSADLRVPCIVPCWYFQESIDWSGEWLPIVSSNNGSIRRSFRFDILSAHAYDWFSRYQRQLVFRGGHQKVGLIYAPDWSQLHYETSIWGFMHDLTMGMKNTQQYTYRVSGRIVESLNGENRP